MTCRHCGLVSPTGMRFCGQCGRPLEPRAATGARSEAHRRWMTVLFCDMVESTPLAEALDAEDFREVLDGYQQVMASAIERFEGYLANYVGDGVVAFFGYPQAHEDDAQRAVHAGLAILADLVNLNVGLQERFGVAVKVRIGVHTGGVVAGETGGGPARAQLDIAGEMPHIAARLESIAPVGSMVISDQTRELVEGYFETEALGEKTLKGISRPIGVHRVLRATGATGRLEVAAARPLTPIVGRERELARLADAWAAVADGSGTLAHVVGEAGIGKSRLVHELAQALGPRIAAVDVWQCSPHHRSTALHPVVRYLERLLERHGAQTAAEQLECLCHAVAGAGLEPAEAVPLLADLLAIRDASGADRPRLTPRAARTAILGVIEALVVADPARQPLLLVVEDLHWADPTTVELLGRIVARLPGIPGMCVLTYRPGFEPPWTPRGSALELELGPLSSDEVRRMAAAASETPLDPALSDWLDQGADGVPLFVEEMVKMLGRGTGDAAPPTAAVPPTLDGLLTERLDRLPELTDVIDLAAILGREFDASVLGALEPNAGLAQLVAEDVLRPVGTTGSRYEFTHALLQAAAYGRILRRRRRELHGRVAEALLETDVAEREPEVVAQHWSSAGQPGNAVPFWQTAGTRALRRAAYLEAAEHFRRGLEALDAMGDDADPADFLVPLAAALQAGHGYAAPGVDEAYARARQTCNDDRLVAVIRGEWMFHLLRGQYPRALELADEMLALGERVELPGEGHLYRGLVHMYRGNLELARGNLQEAFERSRPPGRFEHIYAAQGDTGVGALAYAALVLWNLGHADESHERSERSLARAEQVAGPVARAQAWGMRGILHLSRGEPAEFGEWIKRTHAHSGEYGIGYWQSVSALLAGWLRGRAGKLESGIARMEASLEAYLTSGYRHSLPHFHILLADLKLLAGDRRRALDLLLEGEEYIAASGERFSESELFRFQARVLEELDPPAATAAYERAVAVAREQDAKLLELRAATRLTVHQRALGEHPRVDLGELCDWFAATPTLPDVERARSLLAPEAAAR